MDGTYRALISKCSATWLVLLALAIIFHNKEVVATTSTECQDNWISDGQCDVSNNNVICDYDGGDCCECTCISNSYACGPSYNCLDPWARCDDVAMFHNEDDLNSFSYGFDDEDEDDTRGSSGDDLIVTIGVSVGALVLFGIVIGAAIYCFCRWGRTASAPAGTAAPAGAAAPTVQETGNIVDAGIPPNVIYPCIQPQLQQSVQLPSYPRPPPPY